MYLADCHNHTCCSPDSDADLGQILAQAARMGLSMVCTTDHLDLISRDGVLWEDWDWTPHLEQYRYWREHGPEGVELCLGGEINVPHQFEARCRRLVEQVPLDLVVGSAHNMSEGCGRQDYILWDYKDEETCHHALDDYFDGLLAMSKLDFIDVLAHIPYVLRYMNDRDGNCITLERYSDRLEVILKNLIQRGAGMEVNTNRGKVLDRYKPILQMYKRLGGEIVTLGSDSHRPEDIGKGIEGAAQFLKELGYRYYSVYRRRRPEFIPL